MHQTHICSGQNRLAACREQAQQVLAICKPMLQIAQLQTMSLLDSLDDQQVLPHAAVACTAP